MGFNAASNELANALITLEYVGSESSVLHHRIHHSTLHGNALAKASRGKHEVWDGRFGVERVDEIERAENRVVIQHGETVRSLRRIEKLDIQKRLQRRLFFRIRRVRNSHRLNDPANALQLVLRVSSSDSPRVCYESREQSRYN